MSDISTQIDVTFDVVVKQENEDCQEDGLIVFEDFQCTQQQQMKVEWEEEEENNTDELINQLSCDASKESKSLQCVICQKKFHYEIHLRQHIYTHVPEDSNRFPCHLCSSGFSRKDSLNRHMSIHLVDGGKPYECNHCDREFSKKRELKRHMNTHSPDTSNVTSDLTVLIDVLQKAKLSWVLRKNRKDIGKKTISQILSAVIYHIAIKRSELELTNHIPYTDLEEWAKKLCLLPPFSCHTQSYFFGFEFKPTRTHGEILNSKSRTAVGLLFNKYKNMRKVLQTKGLLLPAKSNKICTIRNTLRPRKVVYKTVENLNDISEDLQILQSSADELHCVLPAWTSTRLFRFEKIAEKNESFINNYYEFRVIQNTKLVKYLIQADFDAMVGGECTHEDLLLGLEKYRDAMVKVGEICVASIRETTLINMLKMTLDTVLYGHNKHIRHNALLRLLPFLLRFGGAHTDRPTIKCARAQTQSFFLHHVNDVAEAERFFLENTANRPVIVTVGMDPFIIENALLFIEATSIIGFDTIAEAIHFTVAFAHVYRLNWQEEAKYVYELIVSLFYNFERKKTTPNHVVLRAIEEIKAHCL